jgi:hypothetical protein
MQQPSRLAGHPVQSAPDVALNTGWACCVAGGAAPQQPATSAQDAAARRRLLDAVQRNQSDAAPAAATGGAAELQHLLSLQGMPPRWARSSWEPCRQGSSQSCSACCVSVHQRLCHN